MQPDIRVLAIILIGAFNPKIYHPYWMKSIDLLTETEAGDTSVQINNNDISVFSNNWVRFEATQQRLAVQSEQIPYFERIVDIILGLFRELKHTPVYFMGINHHYHYMFNNDEDKWHRIGHTLAPKKCWLKEFKDPGLENIEISASREDGYKGRLKVRCGISKKLLPGNGLEIQFNDHYEIGDPKTNNGADEMVRTLEKQYLYSCNKSKRMADTILSCADEKE